MIFFLAQFFFFFYLLLVQHLIHQLLQENSKIDMESHDKP